MARKPKPPLAKCDRHIDHPNPPSCQACREARLPQPPAKFERLDSTDVSDEDRGRFMSEWEWALWRSVLPGDTKTVGMAMRQLSDFTGKDGRTIGHNIRATVEYLQKMTTKSRGVVLAARVLLVKYGLLNITEEGNRGDAKTTVYKLTIPDYMATRTDIFQPDIQQQAAVVRKARRARNAEWWRTKHATTPPAAVDNPPTPISDNTDSVHQEDLVSRLGPPGGPDSVHQEDPYLRHSPTGGAEQITNGGRLPSHGPVAIGSCGQTEPMSIEEEEEIGLWDTDPRPPRPLEPEPTYSSALPKDLPTRRAIEPGDLTGPGYAAFQAQKAAHATRPPGYATSGRPAADEHTRALQRIDAMRTHTPTPAGSMPPTYLPARITPASTELETTP